MNAYQRKPVCTGRLFVSVSRSISFQQSRSVDKDTCNDFQGGKNCRMSRYYILIIIRYQNCSEIHTIIKEAGEKCASEEQVVLNKKFAILQAGLS